MFRRKLKPAGSAAAQAFVRECEERSQQAVKTEIARLYSAVTDLGPTWQTDVANATAFINEITVAREAMRRARLGPAPDPPVVKQTDIATSSLFLYDVWRDLTSCPNGNERMVPITGAVIPDGTRILSQMVPVKMSSQSAAYVQLDPADYCRAAYQLTEIDQHPIMGVFHSHIMRGAKTTRPSAIDLTHQQRLVDFGMPDVLGGIFNLSGHVRIFSTAKDFTLHVHGSHFELLQDKPREKILHLTNVEA